MHVPLSNHSIFLFLPLASACLAKYVQNWQLWDKGIVVYSSAEALTNFSTDHTPAIAKISPKLVWTIQKINDCLIISSWIAAFGSVVECMSLIDKKFNILPSNLIQEYGFVLTGTRIAANIAGFVGIIAVFITAAKTLSMLNNYFWKRQEAAKLLETQQLPGQQVSYDHPFKEKVEECVLIIRVACSVASFILCPASPLLFLNMAIQSYTLLSIAKRQWVKYSLTFNTDVPGAHGTIKQITLGLFMRVYTIHREEEDCMICQDAIQSSESEAKKLDALQATKGVLCCNDHIFHLNCITSWINTNIHRLSRGLSNFKEDLKKEFLKKSTLSQYTADLDASVLPSCPSCRRPPNYAVEAITKNDDARYYHIDINMTTPT